MALEFGATCCLRKPLTPITLMTITLMTVISECMAESRPRHAGIAQFNGRTATFRSNGSTVTGMVRSIVENKTTTPSVWVVTLIPSPLKADRLRPAPRLRAFAEDRY